MACSILHYSALIHYWCGGNRKYPPYKTTVVVLLTNDLQPCDDQDNYYSSHVHEE